MLTHSRKYAQTIEQNTLKTPELIDNVLDAIAYGRIAAKLGWSRDEFSTDIAPTYVAIALKFYEKRMIELHGAPF